MGFSKGKQVSSPMYRNDVSAHIILKFKGRKNKQIRNSLKV